MSLQLVSTAWPPFTNEQGQPRFALDLVEAALNRMGVRSTTSIIDAPAFTSSLLSGRFDGSGAAWKDAERERVLRFSEPYLENRLILVGRRGADVSATTLAALAGKRLAIVQGYSYGAAVEIADLIFVRSNSEEEVLARLLDGGADYALMDELVVRYIVAQYPNESQSRLQLGSTPLVIRPLHFAVRNELPNADSLVERFNAQIRSMIADRTYHRLLHLDWIKADVDGDGTAEYVPQSDSLGTAAPRNAYAISTQPETTGPSGTAQPRFYVGGTLYSDWASIPESYKTSNSDAPDPRRSTASIFTFRW